MTKKLTRLEKSTIILQGARATEWCRVNIDNEFNFMNKTFVIDEKISEYKVHNKAGTMYDYTNEAYMDSILVVVNSEERIVFYNQLYDEVDRKEIRLKE